MDEEESLLKLIRESPDDDRPRLAYADWVERDGDAPRAEFIRVQCKLSSTDLSDSDRQFLMEREHVLLTENHVKWAGYFSTRISEWVFKRGFVEQVGLNLEASAEEILGVWQRAPLRHLRDTSQICNLEGFVAALPFMQHLTGLEFWTIYAVKGPLVRKMLAAPQLSGLRTLILHHDRNGNMIDDRILVKALHSPLRSNLEELAVNVDGMWRGPSNDVLRAIAESPYLRNLRQLNLSSAGDKGNNPELLVESIERLADSANLDGLEVLDLRGTHAKAEVWQAILSMPQLPRLKKLYMCEATEVTTPWIPIIGYLAEMPAWRTAFDERVSCIDWETRFIDPFNGGVWNGLTGTDRV